MNTCSLLYPFQEKVSAVLQVHVAPGSRLCVGLSGGQDSVVLLVMLAALETRLGYALSAIHIHHGLSPNADSWAAFCERLCQSRNVPLNIVKVRVDSGSSAGLEGAARDVRYAAFNEIDADWLLLAHHADDQAETVLHRLLRGSGITGLAGMSVVRDLNRKTRILRPLLTCSRDEILAYATAHQLEWIEDESNRDLSYTRNFIRHELNPNIAGRFPHYRESINRMADHAREHAEFAEALAMIDLQWDQQHAQAGRLDDLPLSRQVNALYHWLRWNRVFSASHAELLTWAGQLFRPATAGKPQRAGGHEVVILRRKNILILEHIKPDAADPESPE